MIEIEERRYGIRSTNQEYYRSHKKQERYIDLKKTLYFDSSGKAKIVFDVSSMDEFSIAVSNLSSSDAYLQTRISPDGIFYKTVNGKRVIKVNSIEFCKIDILTRFIKLHLEGIPKGKLFVYLQGRKN